MDLQNIGALNKDDAFYRYKMPRMITRIEGRGNGVRTRIENMAGIAKSLSRPASYITQYFGYKLGATYEIKMSGTLVNGAHDTTKLNDLLDNFITKYVLCYGCRNPETKIFISRTTHHEMVSLKCMACGFVSDVKPDDKLTKFIIKDVEPKKHRKDDNPLQRAKNKFLKEGEAADANKKKLKDAKKKGVSSKGSSSKGGAANKKAAVGGSDEDYPTSSKFCQDGGNVDSASEDENDVEWQTNTSLEAMKQRMHEQLSVATAEMVLLSTNEFDEKKKLSVATHKYVAVNGSSKPQDSFGSDDKQTIPRTNPYDELVEEIKDKLGNAVTAVQLKSLLSTSTLHSQDVMNALFDGVGRGFNKEVEKNMPYLAALVPDEDYQAMLLLAIEAFGSNCSAAALKEIPFVLNALYYGDVLEEETIVQWYNAAVAGGKNSEVLQNAKPFVEDLQSADYESEQG